MDYRGRLPELYTPDDNYGLNTKRSTEDQTELIEWYAKESLLFCTCEEECACEKPKWDFQTELVRSETTKNVKK